MKDTLKIYNIKYPANNDILYEVSIICNNCYEVFYYYTCQKTLKPVICPFCKSKRRGKITWQKDRS